MVLLPIERNPSSTTKVETKGVTWIRTTPSQILILARRKDPESLKRLYLFYSVVSLSVFATGFTVFETETMFK